MTDNRSDAVTPHNVIVMWAATTLLRKNMNQKTTMSDFADHLLRELDERGFVIVPKEPR